MMKTNWGILGAGSIASKFAMDLELAESAHLVAVASRSKQKADAFAEKFNIEKSFGSYAEMLNDSSIDVVYIATPHSHHQEHSELVLNHGKAVLCEKPFTVNLSQSNSVYNLASQKGLFVMEALWTKFLPHFQQVNEWIKAGRIGKITAVEADFGFKPTVNLDSRIFNPALAGGALLDIGIYPVMIIHHLLGWPMHFELECEKFNSVDLEMKLDFTFEDAKASAFMTFKEKTPTVCRIKGTEGEVLIHSRFHENSTASLLVDSKPLDTTKPYKGLGYHFMAEHVSQCLLNGLKESPVHTRKMSQDLTKLLDLIRAEAAIVYPFEV